MRTPQVPTLLTALLFLSPLHAELPGEGPRLGEDRITQDQIESGKLSLKAIRQAGLKVFSTPFNKSDGYGDGPVGYEEPYNSIEPGGRPTLGGNGTFLRVNGLDGQTCLECHSIVSNASVPAELGVGGVGGSVTNALFQPTFIDVADVAGNGFAEMDGRFINPLFLFGSGGVELLAKEMTAELQGLKRHAQQTGSTVELVTKGVSFGELVYVDSAFDFSRVEGIDHDLVVRPFGRKGEFATVRAFDEAAMMFHFGMQPVESVGADDADGDGVFNEVLPGELSALAMFNTTLERPAADQGGKQAKQGFRLFEQLGCAECHRPELVTDSEFLTYSYPEVAADPGANVFYAVNLARAPMKFKRVRRGGVVVPLFADLKRHDMGPGLRESFGEPPLDQQFTTARLWGVADTAPYLHDGRALTLGEAILLHGGEAQAARDRYAGLEEADQAKLLEFLLTLRTPANPASDLTHGKRR
jgi:mono/diheme cytochrome c family protein